MSTLNVSNIQHESGTGSNITLDNQGNVVCAADVQMASQNGNQIAGLRNQLQNGNFQIWQRGTSLTTTGTAAEYTADRWACNTAEAGIQLEQSTDNNPPGFAYSLTTDGGASNTSGNQIIQSIELPADGNPGPFVLNSVWTISYYLNTQNLTKLPVVDFRDTTNAGPVSLTVSDLTKVPGYESISVGGETWTRYQAKVTIDAAPNATNVRLRVAIHFGTGAGENISGRKITGAQFEPGSVATAFENIPIGASLQLCQRFYQQQRTGLKHGAEISRPGSGVKALFENVTPNTPVRSLSLFTVASATAFSSAAGDTTTTSGITAYQAGLSQTRAAKAGIEYASTSTVATIYGFQCTVIWDCDF